MPEIPKDPRQLARDILSGKISIEELARARAKQQQAGAPGGPPPIQRAPVPDRVPLPKFPPQPPQQRPPARVPPVLAPQRTRTDPVGRPIPPAPLPRKPIPPVPQRPTGPVILRPAPRTPTRPAPVPPRMTTSEPSVNVTVVPDAPPRPQPRGLPMRRILRSKLGLRQGILLSEILGPPLGLRDID